MQSIELTTPLMGANFRPQEAKTVVLASKIGDTGRLVREPENQYDSNAIQIHLADAAGVDQFVGFVGREFAEGLAPVMDGPHEVEICEIVGITGPLKPVFFIKVNDLSDEDEASVGDEALDELEEAGDDDMD